AGAIGDKTLGDEIWDNLGAYQPLMDRGLIQVKIEKIESPLGSWASANGDDLKSLSSFAKAAHVASDSLFDYQGQKWTVTAPCKVSPFFGALFENGITFKTQLAVLRHPRGDN